MLQTRINAGFTKHFCLFKLNNIILPKDSSDILFDFYILLILYQHINLHWFLWKQMFRLKFQILCFIFQLNLQCRIKSWMPLDFVIVCVQSFSPFMIVEFSVFVNAYVLFLSRNAPKYTSVIHNRNLLHWKCSSKWNLVPKRLWYLRYIPSPENWFWICKQER